MAGHDPLCLFGVIQGAPKFLSYGFYRCRHVCLPRPNYAGCPNWFKKRMPTEFNYCRSSSCVLSEHTLGCKIGLLIGSCFFLGDTWGRIRCTFLQSSDPYFWNRRKTRFLQPFGPPPFLFQYSTTNDRASFGHFKMCSQMRNRGSLEEIWHPFEIWKYQD